MIPWTFWHRTFRTRINAGFGVVKGMLMAQRRVAGKLSTWRFMTQGVCLGGVGVWVVVLKFWEGVDVVDTIIFSICFPPFLALPGREEGWGNSFKSLAHDSFLVYPSLAHYSYSFLFVVCRGIPKRADRQEETRPGFIPHKTYFEEGGGKDQRGKGTGAGIIVLYLTCWSLGERGFVFVFFRHAGRD